MIDLNELLANKQDKKYILSKVSKNSIFSQFYRKSIIIGRKVSSPFREDKNPSFVIYLNQYEDLIFKDFATGASGDAFNLIMELYNCSFMDSLKIILNEFGLEKNSNYSVSHKIRPVIINPQKIRNKIRVTLRDFNLEDKQYWSKFYIKKSTLIKFRVKPIKTIFTKASTIKADKLSYVFSEKINDEIYLKIYQPYSSKIKWISSMPKKVLFGWNALPEQGDILIITKALKEVMSIYDTLGIPAIGLQSESIVIKKKVLDNLKMRFKHIYGLFDNDRQGIFISEKHKKLGIIPIFISEYKNYTDMIEESSLEEAKIELTKLLKI